jgi:hypothetical protein
MASPFRAIYIVVDEMEPKNISVASNSKMRDFLDLVRDRQGRADLNFIWLNDFLTDMEDYLDSCWTPDAVFVFASNRQPPNVSELRIRMARAVSERTEPETLRRSEQAMRVIPQQGW